MAYKDPKDALSDTIRVWHAISHFTDDLFERLKSQCKFNHLLMEIVKREALKELDLDEGIINYCPLCDFYECSQNCLLAEPAFSESCDFGCLKRLTCIDFYECLLEKDWDKARESARKFAHELEEILK